MGQMAVRCCRYPSRSTIVNRGCREFVLLFQGSLIPSFSLRINAPNASRNDLAGTPISLGEVLSIFCFKFWPQDEPSHDRPAVIFCQLSSSGKLKVEGWAGNCLNFSVHGGRWCKSLEPLSRGFFCTFPPFFSQTTQRRVFFFNLFSKPYVKLHSPRSNNQNIQRNKASWTSDTARVWPISGACGYLQHPKQFTGVRAVI